jgi:invasion protein IalB
MFVVRLVTPLTALLLLSAAAAPAPAPAPTAPPPAAAAPSAPATDPAAAAAAAAAAQFSVNTPVGDWAVRCALTTVKSPAPCDVIQLTVNQDTKQRIMSFSLAYVPSRDAYAMQVIVPTGVALSRGMSLAAGERALNGVRFNRCERDGCYVEMLVDAPTVAALSAAGKSTTVTVIGYGQFNEYKLPVSLTGFPEALDRMKGLSRERAIAIPAGTATPPPLASTPATPAAPTPPPAARPAAPAAGKAAPAGKAPATK